ncbi:MAG: serine/threonine protein kinase, partial [Planctomycetota bacterium]
MIDWEAFYNRFRQPDFLPGYEIGHRLGGGAFGDVYLARKRSIGKAYAVKFLKLEAGQQDAVERELEHVRLFAAIDHPNLVTIEDMGVVMGVPFLILGYAGEDTLARRLKRGELTRESSISFFVQACRGVLALHDRRLAHFDLKPSNVFLRGEVARVGDYGLARLLSDGRATLSFGRGTPQYMAPEMLRNRADHRADIYSLGVILFESMTGQLPYPSTNEIGLALRETDEPPRFTADFPAPLRVVVERCLRLDPRVRYQSAHELLDELGQSARQGDSVVIPWTTNGLVTPVPAGGGAPTPPLPLLAAPPPPPPG